MIDPTPERAQQAQMTSAEAITELQQMRDVRTRGLAQRKYKVRATNEICALDHALSALRAPSAREELESLRKWIAVGMAPSQRAVLMPILHEIDRRSAGVTPLPDPPSPVGGPQ